MPPSPLPENEVAPDDSAKRNPASSSGSAAMSVTTPLSVVWSMMLSGSTVVLNRDAGAVTSTSMVPCLVVLLPSLSAPATSTL